MRQHSRRNEKKRRFIPGSPPLSVGPKVGREKVDSEEKRKTSGVGKVGRRELASMLKVEPETESTHAGRENTGAKEKTLRCGKGLEIYNGQQTSAKCRVIVIAMTASQSNTEPRLPLCLQPSARNNARKMRLCCACVSSFDRRFKSGGLRRHSHLGGSVGLLLLV